MAPRNDLGTPVSPDERELALALDRAQDWLHASDPGAVRLRHGARTVLAALATFVTLEVLLALVGEPGLKAPVAYGVIAAFVCSLSVTDPRPRVSPHRSVANGLPCPTISSLAEGRCDA